MQAIVASAPKSDSRSWVSICPFRWYLSMNQSSGNAAHTVPFLLSRHAPLAGSARGFGAAFPICKAVADVVH